MTVTMDSLEPRELARWWAEATGGEITADYEFFLLVSGGPIALGFQKVEDPTPGKNRWHVDFKADDRKKEVARLVGLGAEVVADHEVPGLVWTVLTDPEGNQFCVSGDDH
ncbi:VOC family protein [Actinocorallia longicatena]|uniref:VOC family protein n=1 Tax=Actinocorallia longicatena TaxID=111803 RepID=A0ABP6QHS7_9ACTN